MQNYYKTIGALVVASAFAAGNASAEIESEIHAGYTSEYLFRGVSSGTSLVETGVDFATEYNGFGLSSGLWYGSFYNGGAFDELDIYGEVSKDLGFATAAVGYIHYENIGALGRDAEEVYFSVAKSFSGIDFSATYYWDVAGLDNDGYTEFAGSKSFELSSCLTLTTTGTLAYLAEQGDLANYTVKVALDYAYSETTTISPFIAHSWSLSDVPTTTNAGLENEFVAGSMLSVSF